MTIDGKRWPGCGAEAQAVLAAIPSLNISYQGDTITVNGTTWKPVGKGSEAIVAERPGDTGYVVRLLFWSKADAAMGFLQYYKDSNRKHICISGREFRGRFEK